MAWSQVWRIPAATSLDCRSRRPNLLASEALKVKVDALYVVVDPLWGVKRTWAKRLVMSAYDPKRTCAVGQQRNHV